MKVQFNWQTGDEGNRWETIATVEKRVLGGMPGRAWKTVLAALLVLAAGATLGVRYRYQLALRHITSDIQATMELESRALQGRDLDLYLAQQDETAPAWRRRQVAYFSAYHDPGDFGRAQVANGTSTAIPGRACDAGEPAGHPAVQDVEMRRDIAWVAVVEGPCLALRARFYRQTRYGWKHTAPRPDFWHDPVELQYGTVAVRVTRRDQAQVESIVEYIAYLAEDISAEIGLQDSPKLEVDFVPDPFEQTPTLQEGRLIITSPWLTGIPLKGAWEPEYLDEIEYWTSYAIVSQFVQPASARGEQAAALGLLRRALVDEYAVLYSQGDPAQAPLLSAMIERRGLDALPEIFASLRAPISKPTFIAHWLEAPPDHADAYFNTLEEIGRRALRTGREDSLDLVARVLFGEHTERMDHLRSEWVDRLRAEWVRGK